MQARDVGVIVIGSQKEKHGLLPEDTDTKIALYVAFKAAALTGAKFVGVINTASEHPYVKHGVHHSIPAVLHDLKSIVEGTAERLGIRRFVLVNGHGGNKLILEHIKDLEKALGVRITFDNSIVELEGAHAASEECSIAAAIGIATPEALKGQGDFKMHPEVGFVGLKEAHINKKIKALAKETEQKGVTVDVELGRLLVEKIIQKVSVTITNMTS